MLVGHFAVGMVAKRIERKVSLGTLVLAAMAADFLWCVFMIAGIDQVSLKQGRGAANYLVASNIAMSHGLLTNFLWGGLFAGAYFLRKRYPRGALVLGAVAVSHWLLDFVAHKPDMALAPGLSGVYGLGLWTSIPATLVVEGGLWLAAIMLYARATKPKNRAGIYAFWIVAALLSLIWYNNIAGPPPPNIRAIPFSSFIFFSLVVAWAYWMNRARPARV
jgi:hypothetical protein